MEESKLTLEEWKALYDAAIKFREIEPWNWVAETDIFGVQNRKTGEIGYCCVMGVLGEVLALAVYHGTEGLNGYKKIQKGRVKPEDPDSLFIQDCLIVTFEDKRFIEKEDLKLIKHLGYKFKGLSSCPIFRSYKPGYFPWYLSRDEVLYMTDALNQAKDICLRLKENNRMLHTPKKNHYLIRVSEIKDGNVVWKDEWREPAPLTKKDYSNQPVDEVRIQRIKNSVKQTPVVWEIDSFFAPTPVMEEDRPFFPYAIMFADHDTGFIYDVYLASSDKYMKEFSERFLLCMENTAIVPIEILARKEEILRMFETYTAKLNIKLTKVKKLQNIDNARKSMVRHFKNF
jgi:hypothetical protein